MADNYERVYYALIGERHMRGCEMTAYQRAEYLR